MLALSGFTITFSQSKDYLRCALVLHVLAIIVVLLSALPLGFKLLFILIVMVCFIDIIRSKTPLPRYHQLSYHPGYWLLHETHGAQHQYEQVSIGFDGGLFLLLILSGLGAKKTLVVFYDQMTPEHYRVLKFIQYQAVSRDKKK